MPMIQFLKASQIQQPLLNILLYLYSGFSVSSLWHFPLLSTNTMLKGQTATDAAETNLHNYVETYHTRFQTPTLKKKNPVKSHVCNDQIPHFSCKLYASE